MTYIDALLHQILYVSICCTSSFYSGDFVKTFCGILKKTQTNNSDRKIMIDKSKELTTSIHLVNEKLHFEGTVSGNTPISIDYIPPLGDNLGYTSLELLLLSLSSCIGSAALIFLRKMKKTITGLTIASTGMRKEEHPTGFKTITIVLTITSSDATAADVDKVMKLAEESYCPVWSMMKGNVDIAIQYRIIAQ
jgi:putative redox protein